jgi:hypothetical protein
MTKRVNLAVHDDELLLLQPTAPHVKVQAVDNK